MRELQNSTIEITNSLNVTQWSDFVYNPPQSNIFQTAEMTKVYKPEQRIMKEPITKVMIKFIDYNSKR